MIMITPETIMLNMTTAEHDHAGHGHPSEGPHHGGLIELGNEEYHAELVHDDDAGTVTLYILDGGVTKQVPIDATEITIKRHAGWKARAIQAGSNTRYQRSGRQVLAIRFLAMPNLRITSMKKGPSHVLCCPSTASRIAARISHDHDHEGHDH